MPDTCGSRIASRVIEKGLGVAVRTGPGVGTGTVGRITAPGEKVDVGVRVGACGRRGKRSPGGFRSGRGFGG